MESKKETSYTYKIEDSADRMDDILDANDNDYEDEGNSIPSRDKLTYKNGYYVDVTAIFIDIVDSSKLTDGHKRPTLAKMYRCFLSECVAVMNSYEICKEININGDCVWGVFETPKMVDVEKVIEVEVLPIIHEVISDMENNMNVREQEWINSVLTLGDKSRKAVHKWKEKTAYLPEYLSEETIEKVKMVDKEADEIISEGKIEDVLFYFDKLDDVEKLECIQKLQNRLNR